MKFHVIIPARLQSSRLPRKVLLDIGGKAMVQRTYEQACASNAASVHIATDSEEVYAAVKQFTDHVLMTKESHPTGTDRIAEAITLCNLHTNDIIVNLQGDEPFIPPIMLNQVAELLNKHSQAAMATLCEPINELKDVFNPNVVKVVMNEKQEALYFSRAPIPWQRGVFHHDISQIPDELELNEQYFRHIGLYAYRAGFVTDYVQWPVDPVEQLEQLEQLRVLRRGYRIAIAPACATSPIGVDTAEDLAVARQLAEKFQ